MFKQVIGSTPFTTAIADGFFDHVTGAAYRGDVSFIATLRALVAPRMPKDNYITFETTASNVMIDSDDDVEITRSVLNCMWLNYNVIHLHALSGVGDANDRVLKALENQFIEQTGEEGWTRFPEVTALFHSASNGAFKVLCFLNPLKKSTFLFVSSLNLKKFHLIQCATLGLVPWYFKPEDGVNEDENELMYALQDQNPDRYLAALEKIAEKYDFETCRIRTLLQDFESRFDVAEISRLKDSIESKQRTISDYNRKIGDLIMDMDSLNISLVGLETRIKDQDGDSELLEYFLRNKRLVLEDVVGDTMYFFVKDYCTYFDEELVKRFLENPNSYAYRYNEDYGISDEEMHRLITAVFLDGEIKLRFCAAYKFSLRGNVSTQGSHEFPADVRSTYMANPHIQNYNCMGNYTQAINELLLRRDYISALEQTVASAKSLNFGDGVVISEFFRRFVNTKAFELPDGTVADTKGALVWLDAQDSLEQEVDTNDE